MERTAGLGVWVLTGALNAKIALLFFALAYGPNAIHGALAVLADALSFPRYRRACDRLIIIGWSMLETFGYRQLTVLWRVRGLRKFMRGRTDCGKMERCGVAKPTAAAPGAASTPPDPARAAA